MPKKETPAHVGDKDAASAASPHFSNFKELRGPSKVSFDIDDVDVAVVNALRRTILSDILNVAFVFDPFDKDASTIVFHENTSALHNEFTGHRLSLIPLCFDESQLEAILRSEVRYRFNLKKHNTSKSDLMDVRTSDFVVYLNDRPLDAGHRNAILPPDPITGDYILITKLKPGEALHVDCTPAIGTARQHAAWCPVSLCVFHNRLDEQAAAVAFAQGLETTHGQRAADGKPPLTADEEREYETRFYILDAKRYFKRNADSEPCAFEFSIESECRLRPAYLVAKGFRMLIERVKRLERVLEKGDSEDAIITSIAEDASSYDVCVKAEGHTLGNLLQSLWFNFYHRESKDLSYVGYYQHHPLEDTVSFRMTPAEHMDVPAFRAFLVKACAKVVDHLSELAGEWATFADVKLEVTSADLWQGFVEDGPAAGIEQSTDTDQAK